MREAVLIIAVVLNILAASVKYSDKNTAGVIFHISMIAIILVCYYFKVHLLKTL